MKSEFIGSSYKKRVIDANRIYDEHSKSGLSNREIFREFIYPIYHISEKTFYNWLNAITRFPDTEKDSK